MEPQAMLDRTDQTAEPVMPGDAVGDETLIEDELLVEEVSIDGMCGVY
ncbi:MAG: mycofactocin precursor MftA [Acidimicrobiales bacterium]